jgi:hypothetical protein
MTALHYIALVGASYLIWLGVLMKINTGGLVAGTMFKFVPITLGIALAFNAVVPWLR